MKKMLLSLSSVLIITVVFFTACNMDDQCKSCTKPPDATEQVSFNLMGESLQSEFEIRKLNMIIPIMFLLEIISIN